MEIVKLLNKSDITFVFGNLHKKIDTEEKNAHEWTVYLRTLPESEMDKIQKVVFNLHETFKPPKVVVTKAPF